MWGVGVEAGEKDLHVPRQKQQPGEECWNLIGVRRGPSKVVGAVMDDSFLQAYG